MTTATRAKRLGRKMVTQGTTTLRGQAQTWNGPPGPESGRAVLLVVLLDHSSPDLAMSTGGESGTVTGFGSPRKTNRALSSLPLLSGS
jgi:hypothetical protein